MRFAVDSFRGMAPRLDPHLLPENAAQDATNCRLLNGNLESFKQFVSTKVLANAGPVPTVYLLNGSWLSFDSQTDIARGLIPGDNTFLTFLTSHTSVGGPHSTPRYTTYALATTGAEPYPVTTKPLGVPAPTNPPDAPVVAPSAANPTVDITDDGSDLTGWTTSGIHPGFDFGSIVQQDLTSVVQPSYQINIENNAGLPAYAYRNFGTAGSAVSEISVDFAIDPAQGDDGIVVEIGCGVAATGQGAYVTISSDINAPVLLIYTGTTWAAKSELIRIAVGAAFVRGTLYTLTATKLRNADGTTTLTAKVYDGATLLQTLTQTNTFEDGDFMALVGVTGDDPKSTFYKNIHVTASGFPGLTIINIATSYVYTFVNTVSGTSIRWESAPSPASSTILRPDGVSVTVTTDTSHAFDVNYGIDAKRIYRAVTGATGTIYRFVAEVALATADYVDELDDSQLGEALESEEWDLPPDDLQGIITLPNGIVAGFRRNQLCLSAQGRPHAWPVAFRLPTDTDIVGIANIDNTVVIGTKSFPYLAGGNDPANYSMTRLDDYPQSCTSKRSFASVGKFGVVFACPDGLMAISGTGQGQIVSSSLLTRDQWQALDPTSIIGVAHDDVYFFSFTGSTPDASYALDAKPDGFGLVSLSFHFIAAHADPLTDKLYLVLDVNSEPTDGSLPLASTAVTASNKTIFEFNAHATDRMVFKWRGRLNMPQFPVAPLVAQVQAITYTNLLAKFYGDSVLLYTKVVTSKQEFRVSAPDTYSTYEMELVGTNAVRLLRAAEDVDELG